MNERYSDEFLLKPTHTAAFGCGFECCGGFMTIQPDGSYLRSQDGEPIGLVFSDENDTYAYAIESDQELEELIAIKAMKYPREVS